MHRWLCSGGEFHGFERSLANGFVRLPAADRTRSVAAVHTGASVGDGNDGGVSPIGHNSEGLSGTACGSESEVGSGPFEYEAAQAHIGVCRRSLRVSG